MGIIFLKDCFPTIFRRKLHNQSISDFILAPINDANAHPTSWDLHLVEILGRTRLPNSVLFSNLWEELGFPKRGRILESRHLTPPGAFFLDHQLFLPSKTVWETQIQFFSWIAVSGRTLTCDRLQKRFSDIPMFPNWRCLCKREFETQGYIFIHCP